MTVTVQLDDWSAVKIQPLRPHNNLQSVNGYRKFTNAAQLPKPVAMTLNSWYLATDNIEPENQEQLQYLMALAD